MLYPLTILFRAGILFLCLQADNDSKPHGADMLDELLRLEHLLVMLKIAAAKQKQSCPCLYALQPLQGAECWLNAA